MVEKFHLYSSEYSMFIVEEKEMHKQHMYVIDPCFTTFALFKVAFANSRGTKVTKYKRWNAKWKGPLNANYI
jgi:hypothetical protein